MLDQSKHILLALSVSTTAANNMNNVNESPDVLLTLLSLQQGNLKENLNNDILSSTHPQTTLQNTSQIIAQR